MNIQKIKQQLKDLRSTMPKYVQWLVLGALFIIVVILLALLFGRDSSNNKKIESAEESVSFAADPETIDLTGVTVGETKNQDVNITVNTPVVFDTISIDAADITTTNNCSNLTESCLINVIYKPTQAQLEMHDVIKITWHVLSNKDIMQTFEIPVVYDAVEKVEPKKEPVVDEPVSIKYEPVMIAKKPEPVVEEPEAVIDLSEPIEIPEHTVIDLDDTDEEISEETEPAKDIFDEEYDDEEIIEEPIAKPVKKPIKKAMEEPVQKKIADEIKAVAKEDTFEKIKTEEFSLPPEQCSDFAIPGYDASGVQIGWIKPERGANYFHPFSDKDCSNPTGRYDFTTGIITSLKNGSKIGTDANHIGYTGAGNVLTLPNLSAPTTARNGSVATDGVFINPRWRKSTSRLFSKSGSKDGDDADAWSNKQTEKMLKGSGRGESVTSSLPYDRTFILRQFKPIPATIVSEVRADPSVYGCDKSGKNCDPNKNHSIPVRATVDRNVFSDDGRTIIIPTGTLLMGYLDGELPGPYQAVGRMNIRWYQFIRPDGVEFNFEGEGQDPYSGDAQGRMGVIGHGSTDYIEQMVMPILTSLVPAAVNMIAPIADTVINQIDLDNNTIVQSGTMRSSEMAKQEIINTWNKVAQKLLVDVMSNTTPPFSIAAGTRINVFSPVDLIVSCEGVTGKACSVIEADNSNRRSWDTLKKAVKNSTDNTSWVGQVRSFNLMQYCDIDQKTGKVKIDDNSGWAESGYDYRTVYAYCESQNYQAINNAKNQAYAQQVQKQYDNKYGTVNYDAETGQRTFDDADKAKAYNQDILGLQYDDSGNIVNPFAKPVTTPQDIIAAAGAEELKCFDGSTPDANGCCTGEEYTDNGPLDPNDPNGPHEYVCCPANDPEGECFEPLNVQ